MLRYSDIDLQFARGQHEVDTPGIGKVYQYLRERGITEQDVTELGLHIVPARELIAASRGGAAQDDPRLAIVFPHRTASGGLIDWWSARLVDAGLRPKVVSSFADLTEKNWGKMYCPPSESPHAYLVPTLDWMQLARGDKVYIHESCIKAINGAKLGYWSIGLNGVRGWSSRKHNVALVEELRGLPWKSLDLRPVIVFDSNAADNWDVQHAVTALAAKLYEITGQRATHILLPPGPDGHWGFDDFCVANGDEAAQAYLDGDGVEVEISELEMKKLELNTEVCIVKSLARVAVQQTGVLMNKQGFTDINYADRMAHVEDKVVSVAKSWLTDSRRTTVERMEYSPGSPPLVAGEYLNTWRGMGVEPYAGEVDTWLELIERRIPDEKLRKWVIQWFAYSLQNLGGKTTAYLHLYGPPGSGKNALLAPFMKIYGDNAIVIGRDNMTSSFNSIYATKQFVNIDELHSGGGMEGVAIGNRIKMITTSPTLTVNTKGQPEYKVQNHVQLVTTANYADAIKLDEGDRRACVVRFGEVGDAMRERFWEEYFRWLDLGGAEALYAYMLGVDMTGFVASDSAPMTEWKADVTDATRGAMDKWCRDLRQFPDEMLPALMQGARFLSSEQLGSLYVGQDQGKNTVGLRNSLGLKMKDAGFLRTDNIKVDGKTVRYWIIRDLDKEWTTEEIRSSQKKLGKF